uniref:Beta chain of the tetrameric hemoglobin (Intracellular) n=1 Tax=Barbatia trapezina TaxID=2784309 RepID=Q17156_9BIVA|nr:beta chain of the tetrameric hemoglobin (intracellular) [Barbatia lima]
MSFEEAALEVTGSEKIKEDLRLTWGILSNELEDTGVTLMLTLFKMEPGSKARFGRFGNIDSGMGRDKLRGHSITLMYALQNFMDSLDNTEKLRCVVDKFAVNHRIRKISASEFGWIMKPIREVLMERMGQFYDPSFVDAWGKLIGVVQASLAREQ